MGYQVDSFDDELHLRLTELAGAAPSVDATALSSIRGRAASQRRRRLGAVLAATTAVLVAAIGATAVAQKATRQSVPATRPTVPATATTRLLGWPTRGTQLQEPAVSRLVSAWDRGSGTPGHTKVRVLYSGLHRNQAIHIVEGETPTGDARIAVLVDWNPEAPHANDPDRAAFQVSMDVPAPAAKPQILLVALTGLAGQPAHYEQAVIALIAPTAPPAELRVTLRTDRPDALRQTLDPADGYASTDISAAPESFPDSATFFLINAQDSRRQTCHAIKPDSDRYSNAKVGDVSAAVLVPTGPAGEPASASPSR